MEQGLLFGVASLLRNTGPRASRLCRCGLQAELLYQAWDLPQPGIEPVSPALTSRFLTTRPQGSPLSLVLCVSDSKDKNQKMKAKSCSRVLRIHQSLHSCTSNCPFHLSRSRHATYSKELQNLKGVFSSTHHTNKTRYFNYPSSEIFLFSGQTWFSDLLWQFCQLCLLNSWAASSTGYDQRNLLYPSF